MAINQSNLAQDIIDSTIGRVSEVAKLIINDYRELRDAKVADAEQHALNNTNNANNGALGALNQGQPGIPTPPLQNGSNAQLNKVFGLAARKLIFEVQFNPTELSLNASALAINKQSITLSESATAAQTNQDNSSATINLNVNLIFDKMNETDAFLLESGTQGVAGIATAATTATALLKGKKFSVKPEVEALMAALRESYMREVEFKWNDFSFVGQLQFVQVRYTMFSPAGHPIRATVAIRMKREASVGDQWEKDFDTTFSGAGGQTLSRTQQNGILNF